MSSSSHSLKNSSSTAGGAGTETFSISELELNTTENISKNVYVVFQLGKDKVQTSGIKGEGNWGSDTWTLTTEDGSLELEVVVYEKHTLRPDAVVGHGTHYIKHGHKQGKLVIPLMSKKGGTEAGSVAFYMHSDREGTGSAAGSGRGVGTGTGTGVGTGTGTGTGAATGAGMGAGAGMAGAGATTGSRGTGHESLGQKAKDAITPGSHSTTSRDTEGVTSGVGAMSLGKGQGLQSVTGNSAQPVCDQKYYTKIEDRPQVREVVTTIREHHPIEKEFVTETRPTGREKEQGGNLNTEVVNSNTRVVGVTERDPCAGVPTSGTGVREGTGMTQGQGEQYVVAGSGPTPQDAKRDATRHQPEPTTGASGAGYGR